MENLCIVFGDVGCYVVGVWMLCCGVRVVVFGMVNRWIEGCVVVVILLVVLSVCYIGSFMFDCLEYN